MNTHKYVKHPQTEPISTNKDIKQWHDL